MVQNVSYRVYSLNTNYSKMPKNVNFCAKDTVTKKEWKLSLSLIKIFVGTHTSDIKQQILEKEILPLLKSSTLTNKRIAHVFASVIEELSKEDIIKTVKDIAKNLKKQN